MSPSAIVNTPIRLQLRNTRFRLPAIVYSGISMDDTSLCFRTAVDLAGMIRDKNVSALEVMEAHLVQIEQTNPKVNAIITMDGEQALARAKQADEAQARGEALGILHGLPMGVKDLRPTKGMRTTYGSPLYKDHVPDVDAISIRAAVIARS